MVSARRRPDTGLAARDTAGSETVVSPGLREHTAKEGKDGL